MTESIMADCADHVFGMIVTELRGVGRVCERWRIISRIRTALAARIRGYWSLNKANGTYNIMICITIPTSIIKIHPFQ